MVQKCKTCKQKTAGVTRHCPQCYNKLSKQAKEYIEMKDKERRGYNYQNKLTQY